MNLQQKRKRRMFFLMPIVVIPLLTLLFWSQGGGQGLSVKDQQKEAGGINLKLPNAVIAKGDENKLTLYQLALKDSQQMAERRREDPYSSMEGIAGNSDTLSVRNEASLQYGMSDPSYHYSSGQQPDANELKVKEKLAELNRQLNEPTDYGSLYGSEQNSVEHGSNWQNPPASLENVPNNKPENFQSDPELEKMSGMLEKIYAIQHPEVVQEKLRAASEKNKGFVYTVARPQVKIVADQFSAQKYLNKENQPSDQIIPKKGAFYGLNSANAEDTPGNKAVSAVINETQTLVSGATAKLRLTEEIMIAGITIPSGSFLYGRCELQNERLTIEIHDIRYKDNILAVSLAVYDLDGLIGIHIPGAITRDAVKQGMDQGIQGMNILSMDPSIGAQAASAGLQATKSLLSKKARLIKCTVKAGYPVLLVDTKRKSKEE